MKTSEIQHRADFSTIRYAQCWEDAALFARALEPSGRNCLSIGSAGDNSFALLALGANHVTAVEMNPAQTACIHLRAAAYQCLSHPEFLELLGSRPSSRRKELYGKCRTSLDVGTRHFWDAKPAAVADGIAGCGKFEHYFHLFRRFVLPLAHPRRRIAALLEPRDHPGRQEFYENQWNNRRWRAIFRIFFSRTLMGALGRDPEFFRYVDGSVADRILNRTRHALTALDPSQNPFLHWILTGTHGTALPVALEEQHFETIGRALRSGRFRVIAQPLERLLADEPERHYGAWNLSDIFEYMSPENTGSLLETIAASSHPGARLAYWNMLAPRSRPESLAHRLKPLDSLAAGLFHADRAFFYSRFVMEEVL
ncbi:MAG: DUF3419 family protein [Verrucomicrobiota bacterium]